MSRLSERDLTTLQFRRDWKSAKFFMPQALVCYALIGRIGFLGLALGWITFVQFAVFAVYDVVALAFRCAATVLRPDVWKFAQMTLLLIECGVYGIIAAAFWYRLVG